MPKVENELPRKFGPYVLSQTLGTGGMGEVFLALGGKPGKEKVCVIKRLYPETRGKAEAEERFKREGQLVLRLNHGAIAQTLSVGDQDGEPYIVQEFIEGKDLSQVISLCASLNIRMPVEMALYIVSEIASALGYVHDLDGLEVVHRDVSPANIRLACTGEVKLLDFGIARSLAQTALTQVGMVVGRPTYTAPELLLGKKADRRADVYSLGVVLWELLAGRPYLADGTSPSRHNLKVVPSLDQVVAKAIHRDLAERYTDAGSLREVLKLLLPVGYDGEKEVREFLAKNYDLGREKKLRQMSIEEASTLLKSPGNRALKYVLFAIGAVVFAAGIGFYTLGNRLGTRETIGDLQVKSMESPTTSPIANIQPDALPTKIPTVAGGSSLGPMPPVAARPSTSPDTPPALSIRKTFTEGELLAEAENQLNEGNLSAALKLARRAAKVGAGVKGHVLAGSLLLKTNQPKAAESEFKKAAALDPSNPSAQDGLERARQAISAQ